MYITGSGIVDPIEIKIIDYSFDIDYSFNWFEMSDGSWKAADRGQAYDHTVATINLHGKEPYINTVISGFITNQEDTAEVNISGLAVPIFGNHVDYDQPITAVLQEYNLKEQKSLNGYSLDLTLLGDTMSYSSYDLSIPELKLLEIGYESEQERMFNVNPTYSNGNNSGSIDVTRTNNDRGKFKGRFKLSNAELGQLLNFQKVNRTAAFDMPNIYGVQYPFGKLSGDTGLRAKLYNIENITYISYDLFSVEITFVEDFA